MKGTKATAKNPECWLPTGQALLQLGCSADTLKRYSGPNGFLTEGEHWRRGAYANSPRVWNIPACQQQLRWHGRLGGREAPERKSRSKKGGARSQAASRTAA